MITIGNKKYGARGIYVGRPSALGNPFRLCREEQRAAVVRDYEDWLAEQLLDVSRYIEIQVQSPADGTGFVAQWYAGGERCGQAFPLLNIGELLFFAYYTESPMIIRDEATRAMLHERGYNILSTAS